jgi:hypothetical protein
MDVPGRSDIGRTLDVEEDVGSDIAVRHDVAMSLSASRLDVMYPRGTKGLNMSSADI